MSEFRLRPQGDNAKISGPGGVTSAHPGPDHGNLDERSDTMANAALPSPDLLRQLLSYDRQTGRLTWIERNARNIRNGGGTARSAAVWNGKYAGRPADATISNGYRIVVVHGRRIPAHRAAWAIEFGTWPNAEIDHLNHVRCDNRIENLRDVPRSENCKNQSLRSDNKSGLVGIWERKPKAWGARWQVIISAGGRIVQRRAFRCLGAAVRFRNDGYRSRGFLPQHGESGAR